MSACACGNRCPECYWGLIDGVCKMCKPTDAELIRRAKDAIEKRYANGLDANGQVLDSPPVTDHDTGDEDPKTVHKEPAD